MPGCRPTAGRARSRPSKPASVRKPTASSSPRHRLDEAVARDLVDAAGVVARPKSSQASGPAQVTAPPARARAGRAAARSGRCGRPSACRARRCARAASSRCGRAAASGRSRRASPARSHGASRGDAVDAASRDRRRRRRSAGASRSAASSIRTSKPSACRRLRGEPQRRGLRRRTPAGVNRVSERHRCAQSAVGDRSAARDRARSPRRRGSADRRRGSASARSAARGAARYWRAALGEEVAQQRAAARRPARRRRARCGGSAAARANRSSTEPAAPVFGSAAPKTTRLKRACISAIAHIAHGSSVTYSSHSGSR